MPTRAPTSLTLVLPAYNEAARIGPALNATVRASGSGRQPRTTAQTVG